MWINNILKYCLMNFSFSGLVILWLQYGGKTYGSRKALLTILNLLEQIISIQAGIW